jgi:peptide/nickel transport system permease protein
MSTGVAPEAIAPADPVASERQLEMAQPSAGGFSARWVVRRLLLAVVTLFVVSLIVFAATQILPGDAAKAIAGHSATPSRVAEIRRELNLDRPAIEQYLSWIGGVLHGDLGSSLAANEAVSSLLGPKIVDTLLLVTFSIALTLPLSLLFGVWAAVRRDKALDKGFQVLTLVFTAVPDFVVGLVLAVVFATTVWTILPGVSLIPEGTNPLAHLNVFVLPVATLVLVSVPYLARLIRASMIDTLQSEYVQLARLKGLRERDVLLWHALPNALIPAIQGAAQVLAYMAGGIVLVEYVFSFPGIGGALVQAVQLRDLPTVQVATLFLAGFYILVNLVADLLTVLVTPRLRTEGR